MGQTGVAEYSSTLPQRKRTQIIEKFAKGDIKMCVTLSHDTHDTTNDTTNDTRTLTVAPRHPAQCDRVRCHVARIGY